MKGCKTLVLCAFFELANFIDIQESILVQANAQVEYPTNGTCRRYGLRHPHFPDEYISQASSQI